MQQKHPNMTTGLSIGAHKLKA